MLQCATGRKPDDSVPLTAELYSFLQLFSECLGVDCVSLEELQHLCSGAELRFKSAIPEVYFQMLSTPGQTTSADKWKEAAVKFGAAQSVVHPQARYDELSYRERALILKRLCEHHLVSSEKLRAEVKRLGPAALRRNCPLGSDMQGNQYWMLEDHTCQAILFAEKPYDGAPGEDTQYAVVARNLDEIAVVLEHLKAQMVQALHDAETALIENKHCKSATSKLVCVICARRIRGGAEVCICCQCSYCSHAECIPVAVHPAGKWFCPACSLSQQKLLITSLQEMLERLVPIHQMHCKAREQTERQLKRLSYFYGRPGTIGLCQSRLRTRGEINYSRQPASRLSRAEEEYHLSCHSSSSEERSIESGEEEERLTRRGQQHQSLLETRKKEHSAPCCQDEKENAQLN